MSEANSKIFSWKDIGIKSGIAGVSCGMVSAVLNPIDVTKIRMQNQSKFGGGEMKYTNLFQALVRIFREEGFSGWMRGITPSMGREVSYSSIRIGAYEPFRLYFTNLFGADSSKTDNAPTSPGIKFLAALFSGFFGAYLATPFDLVKTRFQATLPPKPGDPYSPYASQDTIRAFKDIVEKEGGVATLYRGWEVNTARGKLTTATCVVTSR